MGLTADRHNERIQGLTIEYRSTENRLDEAWRDKVMGNYSKEQEAHGTKQASPSQHC